MTLVNYAKTDSLTTTLNDYGTKEWTNNISVPQHEVINENNTALYPIVELVNIWQKVNVEKDNPQKRLKIESIETYNGIYEYTGIGFGTGWMNYENESAAEKGYRINIRARNTPETIIIADYREVMLSRCKQ